MFSFFTGKKNSTQDQNLRLYENVGDKSLTPKERIAGATINIQGHATGLYPKNENKNVFTLALAMDDLETFTFLTQQLSLEVAFNPTKGKTWLEIAMNAQKHEFIRAFFETKNAFTAEEVASLPEESIDAIFETFRKCLKQPGLYHIIELILTKGVLPIINHMPANKRLDLQTKLETYYYREFFKILAFQTGTPPTKSTQLLGLLMKHQFIKGCESTGHGNIKLSFIAAAEYQHVYLADRDKNAFYLNLQYLLGDPHYNAQHATLLHCHHYFKTKQEFILKKSQKMEFDGKLQEFIEILDLINKNEMPADEVKNYILAMCQKKTGASDFRVTIFALANLSDEDLKESYAAYLAYVNAINDEENNALNAINISKALYAQRSNPIAKIHDYFTNNPKAKNFDSKVKIFDDIKKICEEDSIDREMLKKLSLSKPFVSGPQIVTPPRVSPFISSQAHVVWPSSGQFADLVRGLKHWDMGELKKKYEEYKTIRPESQRRASLS